MKYGVLSQRTKPRIKEHYEVSVSYGYLNMKNTVWAKEEWKGKHGEKQGMENRM